MVAHFDPEWELHVVGWYGLAVVSIYYFVASVALRWRPKNGTHVVRYEPPSGISPATAAYLRERGASDKPLAVAIVSMAAKGYLRVEQGPEDYLMSRADASVQLEPEEEIIAEGLFGRRGNPVRLLQLSSLPRIARQLRESIESAIEPDLFSPHFPFFVPGVTISLWCAAGSLLPEMQLAWRSNGNAAFLIPVFFAVWSLLATIRTLPAMLYKLESLLPGRSPYRMRFVKPDATFPVLVIADMGLLAVIGWAISPQFALLFGGFVLVNLVAWSALRAPTRAGWDLLHQLYDFRTFLAAVDSDRVNRMNQPDAPSAMTEKYWGWALALDIEHTWGEQFAAAVLNRMGPGSAIASIEGNLPEDPKTSHDLVDMHLK